MKKKKNAILLTFILCAVCFPLLFCGCGKSRADIENTEADSLTEENSEEALVSEGPISFELTTDMGSTIKVSSLSMEDETSRTGNIYEAFPRTLTDDDIRDLAAKFFDNGEYTVVTPYSVATDDELRAEQAYYLSVFPESSGEEQTFRYEKMEQQLDLYLNSEDERYANRERYTRGEDEILVPVTKAGIYGTAGSQGMLRGTVHGEPWVMDILVHCMPGSVTEPRIEIDAYCLTKEAVYERSRLENVTDFTDGGNLSEKEICEKQAEELLDKLGYSGLECLAVQSNHYREYAEEMKTFQNGYLFVYGCWDTDNPSYQNTDCGAFSMEDFDSQDEYDYPVIAPQPYVYVDSSDNKVQEIYMNCYMGNRKLLQADSELLSRSTVLEKLKSVWGRWYDSSNYSGEAVEVEYDQCALRLRYVMVASRDENRTVHYNLLPVWILSSGFSSVEPSMEYTLFGVCAIDASWIQIEPVSGGFNSSFQSGEAVELIE